MADFPNYAMPPPPVLSVLHPEVAGVVASGQGANVLFGATSQAWLAANTAYFFPFVMTAPATVYGFFFWVGATSTGHIDVGIYDWGKNLVSHAGTTTMSATTGTLQILDVTDFTLNPGRYLLAGACDTTSGTVFRPTTSPADELALSSGPVYEQTGLTLANLPDPAAPVVSANATPCYAAFGIQFRSTL